MLDPAMCEGAEKKDQRITLKELRKVEDELDLHTSVQEMVMRRCDYDRRWRRCCMGTGTYRKLKEDPTATWPRRSD